MLVAVDDADGIVQCLSLMMKISAQGISTLCELFGYSNTIELSTTPSKKRS